MTKDSFNPAHYIADENKVFRCKIHGIIIGNEVYLGVHKINGRKVKDVIDNYEEVDDIQNDRNIMEDK